MKVVVHVQLREGVLDPQGKAIAGALNTLGFAGVVDARQSKVIALDLEDMDESTARARVDEMCRKLLANTVIETYSVSIEPAG